MSKTIKLIVSIFVGLDIFVFAYLGLAQLRFNMFGEGQIPGGGSALDMALFLIPVFLAYVTADRLYYFLTYKERRAAQLNRKQQAQASSEATGSSQASVWEDRGWEDEEAARSQKSGKRGNS